MEITQEHNGSLVCLDSMRFRHFVLSDLSSLRQMIHDTIDACYSGVYPERAVEFFKTSHSEERILERS